MGREMGIGPLRSLVAVADSGGFQRAATTLHLTQSAISQHVRRLEAAIGRPLVERHGRGSRFTPAGEQLLVHARRILDAHDQAVHALADPPRPTLRIGSTEHAAAQLLPALAAALDEDAGGYDIRFRVDRGSRLRQSLAGASIDVALLLGSTDPGRRRVGDLGLTWYAAPGWRRPAAGRPLPVVAFDKPCALRTRALDTLAAHAVPATVSSEATQLAGVHAAVAAGLGVALMATLGDTPPGLVPRDDLPAPGPLELVACPRAGLSDGITEQVVDALRPVLAAACPSSAGVPTPA